MSKDEAITKGKKIFFINKINLHVYDKIYRDKPTDTNAKNHTYYCLFDLSNINDLDFENIILDEKSYEDIFFNYLGYKSSYSVWPFCIIFHEIKGHSKDHIGVEHLTLVPSKDKVVLTKCEESIDKTKHFINADNNNCVLCDK